MAINAYPMPDGRFYLRDDAYKKFPTTYFVKDKIKAAGGEWDADKKLWTVPAEAVAELPVEQMIRCRVAGWCHEPETETWVTWTDYEKGTHRRGCSRCDTSHACGRDCLILEVVSIEAD